MVSIGEELKIFNGLYREMDEFYHSIALKMGLSDSAYIILYAIYELGEGCLQRDICNMYWVSKQTIHSAIRKLGEEGCLFLKQGKGKDKNIFLTEKGKRLLAEKIQPVVALENSAFESMTKEENGEMLRLLRQYLEKMKENSDLFVK